MKPWHYSFVFVIPGLAALGLFLGGAWLLAGARDTEGTRMRSAPHPTTVRFLCGGLPGGGGVAPCDAGCVLVDPRGAASAR